MSEARLKTEIWIKAHIRKCAVHNIPVMVVRRGDATAGNLIIKLNLLGGGFQLLMPDTDWQTNSRYWRLAMGAEAVDEAEADAYIERQVGYDRDLWVIEMEDREGRHMLDEPVRV